MTETTTEAPMRFNADLAERVLAQIKDHPETWEQDSWRCGTTMCFAGWTGELLGVQWEYADFGGYLQGGGHVSMVAQKALGLTNNRRVNLFGCPTDIDEIEKLVKHFANNPDDDSLPS